jgi:hypothetical protein
VVVRNICGRGNTTNPDRADKTTLNKTTQHNAHPDTTPQNKISVDKRTRTHLNKVLFSHQKMNSPTISSNQAAFTLNSRLINEADS